MEWGTLIYDYLVFAALILCSFGVAIYGRFSGNKEKTKADFAFAKSNSISMPAMMLSIARGFLGVRVFLGYPSELYYRGSAMWETLYGMIIAFPIVCYFFVPVYYSLGITSVYQYLDLRFKSRLVRCLASGTYLLRSVLNLGVTVFTPCVALKTIIGMPYWTSITAIVGISIFFTMMGGLRTAIIADVTQLLVMVGCSAAIIIQGTITAGGVVNVVNASSSHGRLQFFDFDMDPTIRVNTVSAIIGQLFMSLSIFGCQQNFVQRYCSMSSQSKVNKTLMANIPIMTVLFSLSWVVGMVIFANYMSCDPKALGYISDIDEILPFYVEDKFYFLPGFLGLVMACLFNGALNLMVSNLNSLSIVMWEDFFYQIPALKNTTDRTQLVLIKVLGAVCGVMIMGVAFIVAMLSGVIEASQLMTSATSGPLLGVFILAMFVPPANWKGAAFGMLASHAIVLWITFGSLTVDKPSVPFLPVSVDGCTNTTFSPNVPPLPPKSDPVWTEDFDVNPVIGPAHHDNDFLTSLYSMTYMYYSLIGTVITVLFGTILSYITASEEDCYDEKLVHPWARKLYKWLPGKQKCFVNLEQSSTETISSDKVERYKTNKI
ncbi:sodium-coupled monocarboxylate transporter 1 [Cimex lectularius]|uniref:Sodium/solute symporter n=1 Tax=Cimex lectularius TaxID=79782 RepID=A0A8I6S153_CIMLE|nr:sodium-coupled monocarboxylate transporter 1 [Cimex lectularius]